MPQHEVTHILKNKHSSLYANMQPLMCYLFLLITTLFLQSSKWQYRPTDLLPRDYPTYPGYSKTYNLIDMWRSFLTISSLGQLFHDCGEDAHRSSDRESNRRALFQEQGSHFCCILRLLICQHSEVRRRFKRKYSFAVVQTGGFMHIAL